MGREEQTEEREVLDSIFPEEITDVDETTYRVSIALEQPDSLSTAQGENDDDDQVPAPTILLQVQYPESYPDEAPRLDIQNPPNAAKYAYLDVHGDKARLLDSLAATVDENLGMAMVFALVTTLKDSAELLIAERVRAVEAEQEMEAAAAEREENRKFEGTKVTRETFLEWSRTFKKEVEEESRRREVEREEELKKKRVKEEKKMTGRELWEKGIATSKVGEEDEGEGVDVLEAVRSLKVES